MYQAMERSACMKAAAHAEAGFSRARHIAFTMDTAMLVSIIISILGLRLRSLISLLILGKGQYRKDAVLA